MVGLSRGDDRSQQIRARAWLCINAGKSLKLIAASLKQTAYGMHPCISPCPLRGILKSDVFLITRIIWLLGGYLELALAETVAISPAFFP